MAVGPLRVSAGVIRLRPVRMRDGVHWSRIRLADRAHLEPWEPSADGEWTVRHTVAAWPAVCSGLRSEARNGRMLPYVIELDGQFCGQLTIGNVTHGALRSAWIGYWVPSAVDRAWRDHLLMAITVEEVYGSVASTLVRAGHASWP